MNTKQRQIGNWLSESCSHKSERRECAFCLAAALSDVSDALGFASVAPIIERQGEVHPIFQPILDAICPPAA